MEKISFIPKFRDNHMLVTLLSGLVIALGIIIEPMAAIFTVVFLILITLSIFHWEKIIWFTVPTLYLGFAIFAWPLGKLELGFPIISLLIIPFMIHIFNKLIRGRIAEPPMDWSIFILFTIFTIFVFLSLLWTSNFDYGLKKAGIFCIQALLPAMILLTSKYSDSSIRLFGLSLQLLSCFIALQLFFWGSETALYPGRNTLPDVNPIWLSRIAVLGAIASLWNLSYWKGNRKIIINGAVVLLSLWVIVSTGSRGPAIAFILSSILAIILILIVKKGSAIKFFKYSTIVAIGVFILFTPMLISPEQPFRYINILQDPTDIGTDKNIEARLLSFANAYSLFKQNMLIGKGIGGYSEYLRDYPHNLILEILSEGGIMGIILFLAIIISLFKKILASGGYAMSRTILFMTAVVFSLTSGDLGSNYEWVIVGVSLMYRRR